MAKLPHIMERMTRKDSAWHGSANEAFCEFLTVRDEFEELREAHESIHRRPFDRDEHDRHRARLRALIQKIQALRKPRSL